MKEYTKEKLEEALREMIESKKLPTKDNPFMTGVDSLWVQDGIIYRDTGEKDMTIEVAQRNVMVAEEIAKLLEAPVKLLVLMNKGKMPREARELYGKATFVDRLAIVVGSPIAKIAASFFSRVNKADSATEVFNSKKKAILWLKGDG